jgi:hypothetical protein
MESFRPDPIRESAKAGPSPRLQQCYVSAAGVRRSIHCKTEIAAASNDGERSRNLIDAQGLCRICWRDGGHWPMNASDFWLLASESCFSAERSRNVLDKEGRLDLCRKTSTKGVMIGAASHLSWKGNGRDPKSNRYTGGAGQNHLAGRNVQKNERRTALSTGYKLQVNPVAAISDEKAGKSGKHPKQAGMYKGMNSLSGYVASVRRDNWDFREILHRIAPEAWHCSCPEITLAAVHFRSRDAALFSSPSRSLFRLESRFLS